MEWKTITLEVSDNGDVKLAGKILKSRTSPRGYQNIDIAIHRIVAFAFHGMPPSLGYVVDHIDGNPRNNQADNLRWVSQRQNSNYHFENKPRKLSEEEVLEILEFTPESTITLQDLAKEFRVAYVTVLSARSGTHFSGKKPSNRAILTPEQVDILRAWKPHSPTAADLARKYKVSKGTILNIWNGKY